MSLTERRRHRAATPSTSSDRMFGGLFTLFFAFVALWPLLGGSAVRLWALGLAALFAVTAALSPAWLAPLNRMWLAFGALLHRIVSPLALLVLFFAVVTPMALLMRLLGKDPLRLRWDGAAASYWIPRAPPGPEPQTMNRQF